MTKPITNAEAPLPFARRHIGPSQADINAMLETIGAASLEKLIEQTLPPAIRQREPLKLNPALSESEAL